MSSIKLNYKLLVLLFLVYSLTTSVLFSQLTDGIKKSSDENKENHESGNSGSSGSTNCCGDGCGCTFENMNILFGIVHIAAEGLYMADSIIKTRQDTIPRINSINLFLEGGLAKTKNSLLLPRILINGGLFATDFRFYALNEKDINNKSNNYNTFDWQILMFNVVVNRKANFRFGSGFMYEDYSKTFFNESTAVLDIYPYDVFRISVEGRITPDFSTKIFVRQEINLGAYYTFKRLNNIDLNIFTKYSHSNYYEKVKFGAVHAGLEISFN